MIHERKPVFVNSPAHAEVMRAVAISNNELLDNKISSIIKIGEVLTHERFFFQLYYVYIFEQNIKVFLMAIEISILFNPLTR